MFEVVFDIVVGDVFVFVVSKWVVIDLEGYG